MCVKPWAAGASNGRRMSSWRNVGHEAVFATGPLFGLPTVPLGAAFICAILVAGLSAAYAWLVKPVLDGLFISRDERLLVVLPLAILAVAVLKGIFNYGQNYLMNCREPGHRDIREQLFTKLVHLPVRHDTNTRAAWYRGSSTT
ncbi:MAG: ABC transporter transmembrane domain-containing protein [Nitrospiraceae bacterium]